MITYQEKRTIEVRLDGKLVGEIRGQVGQWQYFPKGGKKAGDVFATVAAVKESIEAE